MILFSLSLSLMPTRHRSRHLPLRPNHRARRPFRGTCATRDTRESIFSPFQPPTVVVDLADRPSLPPLRFQQIDRNIAFGNLLTLLYSVDDDSPILAKGEGGNSVPPLLRDRSDLDRARLSLPRGGVRSRFPPRKISRIGDASHRIFTVILFHIREIMLNNFTINTRGATAWA